MISAEEVTRLALSLPDARAEPHFGRVAFKARIAFATLAEAEAALREVHALAGPKPRAAKSRHRPEA